MAADPPRSDYTLRTRYLSLTGVMQTRRYAIDRCPQRVVEPVAGGVRSLPAQQFHLNQAHRVHIRITQPNGLRKARVSIQQPALARHDQQQPPRALELVGQYFENSLA